MDYKDKNFYIPFIAARKSLRERFAQKLSSIFNTHTEPQHGRQKIVHHAERGMRITPRFAGIVLSLAAATALTAQLKPLESIKAGLRARHDQAQMRDDSRGSNVETTIAAERGNAQPPPLAAPAQADRRTPLEKRFTTPNFMIEALYSASTKSDFNFMYLFHLSRIESLHTPFADVDTTSALGAFQFTDGTWIRTFVRHAEKYGYGDYASQIRKNQNGDYVFPSAGLKNYITIQLRQNPEFSAEMAAELAKDNLDYLNANYPGKKTLTELYTAHFFGEAGAVTFLNAKDNNPGIIAASILPKHAEKNPDFFYSKGKNGALTGRTVAELYRDLTRKMPPLPIVEKDRMQQLNNAALLVPRI